MAETYLSFVGSVQVPEKPAKRWTEFAAKLSDLKRQLADADKNISMDWAWKVIDQVQPRYDRLWRKINGLEVLLKKEEDNISLTVYRLSAKRALVVSYPVYGDWVEARVILWPVLATGPAQVAGSCCNPQNMLGGVS